MTDSLPLADVTTQYNALLWKLFLRIEKQRKKTLSVNCVQNNIKPEEIANRYLKILLKQTDSTAMESVINAAFSNLDNRSLSCLKEHLQQLQQNVEPSAPENIHPQKITFFPDAYMKWPLNTP